MSTKMRSRYSIISRFTTTDPSEFCNTIIFDQEYWSKSTLAVKSEAPLASLTRRQKEYFLFRSEPTGRLRLRCAEVKTLFTFERILTTPEAASEPALEYCI